MSSSITYHMLGLEFRVLSFTLFNNMVKISSRIKIRVRVVLGFRFEGREGSALFSPTKSTT